MERILIYSVGIVAMLVAMYFGSILMVQKIMRKSRSEAEALVNKKVEEIISFFSSQPPASPNFDVLIGANGVCIRDEIVNRYFEGFYKIWEDWFFSRCYPSASGNLFVYNFRVYNPLNANMSRLNILHKAKQVAEKALTRHFHDSGIYNVDVDNFIVVNQKADVLVVLIAQNEAGFSEIADLRRRLH